MSKDFFKEVDFVLENGAGHKICVEVKNRGLPVGDLTDSDHLEGLGESFKDDFFAGKLAAEAYGAEYQVISAQEITPEWQFLFSEEGINPLTPADFVDHLDYVGGFADDFYYSKDFISTLEAASVRVSESVVEPVYSFRKGVFPFDLSNQFDTGVVTDFGGLDLDGLNFAKFDDLMRFYQYKNFYEGNSDLFGGNLNKVLNMHEYDFKFEDQPLIYTDYDSSGPVEFSWSDIISDSLAPIESDGKSYAQIDPGPIHYDRNALNEYAVEQSLEIGLSGIGYSAKGRHWDFQAAAGLGGSRSRLNVDISDGAAIGLGVAGLAFLGLWYLLSDDEPKKPEYEEPKESEEERQRYESLVGLGFQMVEQKGYA